MNWGLMCIADRTAEITRLENIARGMRTSYLHANSPPRFPSKQSTPSSLTPLTPSSPTNNGVDENHLAVRSASTTRMITTLQKEMDALKTSSEAARAAAGAPSHTPIADA